MSTNFAFLAPRFPELAGVLAAAEDYVHRDPPTALAKLRLFGERLVHETVRRTGFNDADSDGQYDLINGLRAAELLTPDELEATKANRTVTTEFGMERSSEFTHTIGFWWSVSGLEYYMKYIDEMAKRTTTESGSRSLGTGGLSSPGAGVRS